MQENIAEINSNIEKLEELKMSLWHINEQDREPKFEVEGDTLKILTEYAFHEDRVTVMRSAGKKFENDKRFSDVEWVKTAEENGYVNWARIEATLAEPIGDIKKVIFYAEKYKQA